MICAAEDFRWREARTKAPAHGDRGRTRAYGSVFAGARGHARRAREVCAEVTSPAAGMERMDALTDFSRRHDDFRGGQHQGPACQCRWGIRKTPPIRLRLKAIRRPHERALAGVSTRRRRVGYAVAMGGCWRGGYQTRA